MLGMKKADAWIRLVSYIIDGILVAIAGYIISFVFVFWSYGFEVFTHPFALSLFEAIRPLLVFLISAGYFIYFFGKKGMTLGMRLMRIKVCRTDGTCPIGYKRGFLRWVGMIISNLVIGLGFLWILIDKNRQGWHDKIADTYVVVV
ncbi:RDD family protein [Candidatus Alkanophaga liquidiphilum]